jgi:hypothetical protein
MVYFYVSKFARKILLSKSRSEQLTSFEKNLLNKNLNDDKSHQLYQIDDAYCGKFLKLSSIFKKCLIKMKLFQLFDNM